MGVNLTLLGQMITFALFVWFTMRFVWPIIINALEERENTIAKGLSDAERGKEALVLAQRKATEELRKAKHKARSLIENADQQGSQIILQAEKDAKHKATSIVESAQQEIERNLAKARVQLRDEISRMAVKVAEKIVGQHIDQVADKALIDKFIEEV